MNQLPKQLPALLTDRLILRALQAEDSRSILAIYGDPEVMRYTDELPFPTLDTVLQMLQSVDRLFRDQSSLEWGIEQRNTAELIYTCGLHSFDTSSSFAEIGCMLALSHCNRGYMKESLNVLIEFARNTLGLKQLLADIDARNIRCIRLFESLDFVFLSGTYFIRRRKPDLTSLP